MRKSDESSTTKFHFIALSSNIRFLLRPLAAAAAEILLLNHGPASGARQALRYFIWHQEQLITFIPLMRSASVRCHPSGESQKHSEWSAIKF